MSKRALLGGVVAFLLGLVGSLVAAWIQKAWLQDTFSPLTVAALVALSVIGIILGARLDRESPHDAPPTTATHGGGAYWILVVLVAGAIVVAGIAAVLSGGARPEPVAAYFIVDATEKMRPIFGDVRAQVAIAASALPGGSRIGLRAYGGDPASSATCQDSRQLLKLSDDAQSRQQLDSALAGLTPAGHSSLTGAALEALFTDVQAEQRPVKLFVIAAGIDPLCDPSAADFLKDRSKDIGRNVELVIISIGPQDETSTRIFQSYAAAFRGRYVALASAGDLSPVVSTTTSYGYGYTYQ